MVRSLQIVVVPRTWYFLPRTTYFVLAILTLKILCFIRCRLPKKNPLAFAQSDFTGAEQQKSGKSELANGGTLFMYEIADLRVSSQHKLLRVLQEKEIQVSLQFVLAQ